MWNTGQILEILDRACDAHTFPNLGDPYVHLVSTRLSVHHSSEDWALVFEVFGASARADVPDIHLTTFASTLHDAGAPDRYTTEAFDRYLVQHPHDASRWVFPIARGRWIDPAWNGLVAEDATEVPLRGQPFPLPDRDAWEPHGIALSAPPRVAVFELCRYLAAVDRDRVSCTAHERRVSVVPTMREILVLDGWHHPNVADPADRPSGSPTFQQLARVLETGDPTHYRPTDPPNTDWRCWPESGQL